MSKMHFTKKSLTFKIVYLVCSLAMEAYTVYLLIFNVVRGFRSGTDFDGIVIMFATLFAALFEGSIIGFVIRSFGAPTLLMKNLVFKYDGTPFKPGVVITLCGGIITLALAVLFFVSAYAKSLMSIPIIAQCFIADVFAIMSVNLLFSFAFFVTFRHEAGSFAII